VLWKLATDTNGFIGAGTGAGSVGSVTGGSTGGVTGLGAGFMKRGGDAMYLVDDSRVGFARPGALVGEERYAPPRTPERTG